MSDILRSSGSVPLKRGRTSVALLLLGVAAAGLGAWWWLGRRRPRRAANALRPSLPPVVDRGIADMVNETGDESFPASDPPSWTGTVVH